MKNMTNDRIGGTIIKPVKIPTITDGSMPDRWSIVVLIHCKRVGSPGSE
jgi:hypothetical protein